MLCFAKFWTVCKVSGIIYSLSARQECFALAEGSTLAAAKADETVLAPFSVSTDLEGMVPTHHL